MTWHEILHTGVWATANRCSTFIHGLKSRVFPGYGSYEMHGVKDSACKYNLLSFAAAISSGLFRI